MTFLIFFQEKYESILNNKPEASNITKLRKKLKSLKSRHRHLIADINDVEEVKMSQSLVLISTNFYNL